MMMRPQRTLLYQNEIPNVTYGRTDGLTYIARCIHDGPPSVKTVSNCLAVTLNGLPNEWALIYVLRQFKKKFPPRSAIYDFFHFRAFVIIGFGQNCRSAIKKILC